jgi:hypothetical protein
MMTPSFVFWSLHLVSFFADAPASSCFALPLALLLHMMLLFLPPRVTSLTQLPAVCHILLMVSGGLKAPTAHPFNMLVLKTPYLP